MDLRMARLPKHGTSFGSLNESEATIPELIIRLGFRRLTRSQERTVRETIGFAIGAWFQADVIGSDSVMTVGNLRALLSRIAANLQEVVEVLGAVRGGLQHNLHIEAMVRISEILVRPAKGKTIQEGYDTIAAFLDIASPIAESANEASKHVQTLRGSRGRPSQDAYAKFLDEVANLCEHNEIKPTLSTDRDTGASGGKFLAAVEAFELLLPRRMRSPSRDARVQRLRRWRRRRRVART